MTVSPVTLADYWRLLIPDQWRQRKENKFSDDIATVNEVLHDPFANDPQRSDILTSWLSGKDQQPCLFGRMAAKKNGMQFCFLTTEDILGSDENIKAKIAASRPYGSSGPCGANRGTGSCWLSAIPRFVKRTPTTCSINSPSNYSVSPGGLRSRKAGAMTSFTNGSIYATLKQPRL